MAPWGCNATPVHNVLITGHDRQVSGSWEQGSTSAWRRVRARVLARDAAARWGCRAHEERWCEMAAARPHTCTRVATHAHHTRGRAVTGDDPAHIVAACEPCNLAIGEPGQVADPECVPITRW